MVYHNYYMGCKQRVHLGNTKSETIKFNYRMEEDFERILLKYCRIFIVFVCHYENDLFIYL